MVYLGFENHIVKLFLVPGIFCPNTGLGEIMGKGNWWQIFDHMVFSSFRPRMEIGLQYILFK